METSPLPDGINTLITSAKMVRDFAYAPYSRFAVGAALQTRSGAIFVGCNMENISFGLTVCAERNAVASAIAAGEREFEFIVIVADSRQPVTPCGACRQILAEFSDDMEVVSVNLDGDVFRSKVSELLPRAKAGILGT